MAAIAAAKGFLFVQKVLDDSNHIIGNVMSENFESPKLRCLVDVRRDDRNDCKPYKEHPTYRDERRENKKADVLRKRLIRLGYDSPELRPHLRTILDRLGEW